ncbi:hypothetical protein ACIRQP_03465 [Streptomyces sp. NPDC102274]|uniref:phage terminase small subunit n=1 Tax=Streptomyces sp. NPDC102274 TaxID=3366151 RepID=UPI0037F56B70
MSGPAPDPNALRRDRKSDQAGWRTLPAEGRADDAPEWPLIEPSERESELWADLWRKPQAVVWEELGQALEVALFVRTLAEAEQGDARVDIKKMVRQYLDSLGLSVQGMLRHRWKIAAAESVPADAAAVPVVRRPSARDRLKVVPRGEGP